jgi:hypothetical protein
MFSFRRSFAFRIAAPRGAVRWSQEFSLVGSAAPAWTLALGVRLQPPRSPRRKKLQHKIGPSTPVCARKRPCLLIEINVAKSGIWRGSRQKAVNAKLIAYDSGFSPIFAYIFSALAVNYRNPNVY